MNAHLESVGPEPAEVQALLHAIAEAAAGFVDQLDALRWRYPPQGLRGADPVSVMLDQAAAAAHDLHSSATSAADTIAHRFPTNGFPHRTDRNNAIQGLT